nr:hypothetical protein [Pseudomonas aeruginosa]
MTYRHERRCRTGTALMAGGMALAASAFGHAQPGLREGEKKGREGAR